MSLQVRPASLGDIADMHRIRLGVRENRLAEPKKVTESSYLPYVEGSSAWVAEIGDRIAGFAAVDSANLSVWALFVASDAEGSGVGQALHQAMLDWARTQRIDELWLTTSPGTRAERFYMDAGWKRAGHTRDGDLRLHRHIGA